MLSHLMPMWCLNNWLNNNQRVKKASLSLVFRRDSWCSKLSDNLSTVYWSLIVSIIFNQKSVSGCEWTKSRAVKSPSNNEHCWACLRSLGINSATRISEKQYKKKKNPFMNDVLYGNPKSCKFQQYPAAFQNLHQSF